MTTIRQRSLVSWFRLATHAFLNHPYRRVASACHLFHWGHVGKGAIATFALATTVSYAQPGVSQPQVSVPATLPTVPLPPPPDAAPPLPEETVFQAPQDLRQPTAGRYLVYVNGDSPYLLQQVQTVEPDAFVQQYQGRQVIQVGLFSNEENARRQVDALREGGVMAEVSYNNSTYLPPTNTKTSNYTVVVPGSREELTALTQRAIRLGVRQEAIQPKDAPLGPHLSIGPFVTYGEAKEVSRYLNGGGLDARVHYSR